MERRDFVKLVAFATASLDPLTDLHADYAPHEEFQHIPDWPQPEFEYKGYSVRWTGWKFAQGTSIIAGQWVAYAPERYGKHFAVNLPNAVGGVFRPHDTFDVSYYDGWELVNTREGRLELLKQGRAYIMWMIDHKDSVDWTQQEATSTRSYRK